jgi:hypothetical protein
MSAKKNHRPFTSLRARSWMAVAIEAAVVALFMANREIWFGISIPFTAQAVLVLIISIVLLVSLIRSHFGAMNDLEQSIIASFDEEATRVQEAFTRAKSSLDNVINIERPHEISLQNDVTDSYHLIEFELAYQVRVAIDCIRFAIKATEQSSERPEASLQLLDALDRLQSAEISFQRTFRIRSANGKSGTLAQR